MDSRVAFSFISITPPFLYGISASTTAYYTVSPIIRHSRLNFSAISVFHILCSEVQPHILSNGFYIPFSVYPGYLVRCQPSFNSRPHSLETISAMSCLNFRVESLEIRRSHFGFCRCTTAEDSRLDLDISCVLVVDDRRTDLIYCFLMRYGSFLVV